MTTLPLTSIAVLKAKPGQRDALREALTALVEPTRREAGNLDYTLFELTDEPGSFTCGKPSSAAPRWTSTWPRLISRLSKSASMNCWLSRSS